MTVPVTVEVDYQKPLEQGLVGGVSALKKVRAKTPSTTAAVRKLGEKKRARINELKITVRTLHDVLIEDPFNEPTIYAFLDAVGEVLYGILLPPRNE